MQIFDNVFSDSDFQLIIDELKAETDWGEISKWWATGLTPIGTTPLLSAQCSERIAGLVRQHIVARVPHLYKRKMNIF